MRFIGFMLIMLAAAALIGCGSDVRERSPEFDSRSFESFSGSSILCFDTRADNGTAQAGLLLRVDPNTPAGSHQIVLPFPTSAVASNRNILLASGRHDTFTVLSFTFGTPSLGTSAVAFIPEVKPLPQAFPQIDGLEPGVYFQENGIERWFAFVDGTNEIVAELQRNFSTAKLDAIDGVAVAIPEQAEGRDVKRGASVVPQPATRIGNVMLFRAESGNGQRRIALRYAIQPTAARAAAANSGLKFVLIIIIPIFTLIFLDPQDIRRPKLRMVAISLGILLQVLIAALVVWAALAIKKPSADAWVDFGVALLGVTAEVVIILVKSKRKTGRSQNFSPAG